MKSLPNHHARRPLVPKAGLVLWLTGLSGAGKSTIAGRLKRALTKAGLPVCLLDGDVVRRHLCSDLGFAEADRKENIRRVAEVARLMADTGVICIVALISPFRADRQAARSRLKSGQFLEVFINAPLEVCEKRDPKGHYANARAGKIKQFTGISSPYEAPEKPEIVLRTDQLTVNASVTQILQHPQVRRRLPRD
jgi:adenylylsulfate kinase